MSPSNDNQLSLHNEEPLVDALFFYPELLSHKEIGDPHKTHHLRMEGHVTTAIELCEDQLLLQQVQFLVPARWLTSVIVTSISGPLTPLLASTGTRHAHDS